VHGDHAHARLWRDPDAPVQASDRFTELLKRARDVASWGHPRDAAELFTDGAFETAYAVAEAERALRAANDEARTREQRAEDAGRAWVAYGAARRALPGDHAATYRRYRLRDFRRALEALLPDGVTYRVGPATVREHADRVEVETDRLRFAIDRENGTVVDARHIVGDAWGDNLTGGGEGRFFSVVPVRGRIERTETEIEITSPETGHVRIAVRGRVNPGGPAWSSALDVSGASSVVRQTARVETDGGIAAGCRWTGGVFDRWLCPPFAIEGALADPESRVMLPLPAGTLLYCRAGERGRGLALRLPAGGIVSLVPGASPTLVATGDARELHVEWILFAERGELGPS
jgi:hypothetical protein